MATYELGNDIRISIGSTVIGGQQGCSLNRGTDTSDTTTKDSGVWSESEATGLNWSVDCDGLIAVTDEGLEALKTAWSTMETVTVKYGSATKFETGKAIVESFSENAPQKDKCTYSVSLKGVGPLTKGTGSVKSK